MKKLLKLGAVVAALFTATASYAGPAFYWFNPTNVLVAATASISGYPTNSIGTNGIFPGTGGTPIRVDDVDTIGLTVQGYLVTTNTNATTISVTLLPAMSLSSPQVITGVSNIWSGGLTNTMTQNDYCNPGQHPELVFTFTTVTNALNGTYTTNYINFQTNVPNSGVMGGATWLGLYTITNNMSTGSILTNFNVGVVTKYLTKPFAR